MSNLRTWSIPVADIAAYAKGSTLMDAVPRLTDEARIWEEVEVTNTTDDTAYVALMGGVNKGTAPTDDETSVTIAAGESRYFSSVDFDGAFFKGDGSTGSVEIVGIPA